jgi:hypothetical protein
MSAAPTRTIVCDRKGANPEQGHAGVGRPFETPAARAPQEEGGPRAFPAFETPPRGVGGLDVALRERQAAPRLAQRGRARRERSRSRRRSWAGW